MSAVFDQKILSTYVNEGRREEFFANCRLTLVVAKRALAHCNNGPTYICHVRETVLSQSLSFVDDSIRNSSNLDSSHYFLYKSYTQYGI